MRLCVLGAGGSVALLLGACLGPNPAYGESISSTEATSTGSASAGTAEGTADATSDGEPVKLVYEPVVVECVALTDPDPAACEQATDPGYVQVDGDEPDLGGAKVGAFLRFEIDDAAAGLTVISLRLSMTAHPLDEGSLAAEVWEVEPFTLASLNGTSPAKLGGAPLAVAPGLVGASLQVEWTLPTSVLTPSQPVFLGLFTNAADGVDFMDESSAMPPQLLVTAQ